MAPVTRSRAAATSTSPLFQRIKAEAKKDYEMHGKKRREAMPEAIRSSARKSTASKSNVSTTAPVATRIPTSVATTPFIKTSKRKREDEEEEDEIKKQKTHHLTEKRAEKRKRTEEDSVDEKTNSPARETKKLRSTTSKSKMAKNYDEKTDDSIVEVISSGSASHAQKTKKRTSGSAEPSIQTSLRDLVNIEDIRSVNARSDEKVNELTVSGDNFVVRVTTAAGNSKVSMSKPIKRDSKGKQVAKDRATKVDKKEERYGEKESRKGEQDKKEEIKGRLVSRSCDSSIPSSCSTSSSSRQVSKISMAPASRPHLPDIFDIEDDYNTDDSFDDDFDHDDDITDSDSDLATIHTTTPKIDARPFSSPSKKTTGTTTTTSTSSTSFATIIETTSDLDDEDSIPTIRSEGVQREEAGLPVLPEDENEKGQKKPITAEYTNYGNGESSLYFSTEERKIRTDAERRNRTKIEKRNDDLMEYFYARIDNDGKKSANRAMRDYKPDSKRAIQ